MNFKEDYGIFDSIGKTYVFLIRCNRYDTRRRNSIHWIQRYLPILRKYAKKCNHITEFGIDQCISTWAFLASNPRKLVSVDIDLHRRASKFVKEFQGTNWWLMSAINLAKEEGIVFEVIEGDTTKIDIEETDLLFIDTLHRDYHIRKELERHQDKVRKYLIFHDTALFAEINNPINELLDSGRFEDEYRDTTSPGLRIIKRIQS